MSSDLCGNRWISVSGEETDTIATVPYSHVPCLIHMYRAIFTCTVSYSRVPCLILFTQLEPVSYPHVPCLILFTQLEPVSYPHVPCLIHMYRVLFTCTVSYPHVPCLFPHH